MQGCTDRASSTAFLAELSSLVLDRHRLAMEARQASEPSPEFRLHEYACENIQAMVNDSLQLFPSDITRSLQQYSNHVDEVLANCQGWAQQLDQDVQDLQAEVDLMSTRVGGGGQGWTAKRSGGGGGGGGVWKAFFLWGQGRRCRWLVDWFTMQFGAMDGNIP